MRAFVAGGTGALGRRVVARLVARGHRVVVLSRSSANDDAARRLGAEPRRGDLYDAGSLRPLLADSDVVLHLATAIPTAARTRRGDWAANDRVRVEGTRSLIAAMAPGSPAVYLQQSVVWVYGDRKGDWVDETAGRGARVAPVLESALVMEEIVEAAARDRGLRAVLLRCGGFYAADAHSTTAMIAMAARGRLPIIGRGDNWQSPIHTDDAAEAFVLAAERGTALAGQVLHVVDDRPVTQAELATWLSRRLGNRRPPRIPAFVARLLLGGHVAPLFTASVRCRNAATRQTLGWTPTWPDFEAGLEALLAGAAPGGG